MWYCRCLSRESACMYLCAFMCVSVCLYVLYMCRTCLFSHTSTLPPSYPLPFFFSLLPCPACLPVCFSWFFFLFSFSSPPCYFFYFLVVFFLASFSVLHHYDTFILLSPLPSLHPSSSSRFSLSLNPSSLTNLFSLALLPPPPPSRVVAETPIQQWPPRPLRPTRSCQSRPLLVAPST